MAKKCYVGVNNLAQNCSKIYVGVNNVARKVVKGYVGVNGVAQQFWNSETEWRQEADVPYGTGNNSAVVFQNKIHLLGGVNSTKTNHYSWDGSTWREESVLPFNFTNGSAITFDGKIHCFMKTGHYTWDGTSWTQETNLPYPVDITGNNHAVILNGKLTLVGSNWTSYGLWKHVATLNNGSWTVQQNVLDPDSPYLSSVAYNDVAYILGDNQNQGLYYRVWTGSSLLAKQTLPFLFQEGYALVYNGCIHILGGRQAGTKKHYSFDGTSWTARADVPYYNFQNCPAVVYNNRIHIFGNNTGTSVQHWSYGKETPSPIPPIPSYTYNIVPEYTYTTGNNFQVHDLLTLQVAIDGLYQYFNSHYTSSLTSVAYFKAHWAEIRSAVLNALSSFDTIHFGWSISKTTNTMSLTMNIGNNSYPKIVHIENVGTPRYGWLYRLHDNPDPVYFSHYMSISITDSSYTISDLTPYSIVADELAMYGYVTDNVRASDMFYITNFGMKLSDLNVFQNGAFSRDACLSGTAIDNIAPNPPAQYYSDPPPWNQLSPYYLTNKCLCIYYQGNINYRYVISDGNITLNNSGTYGDNYQIYIPVNRTIANNLKIIVRSDEGTRLWVAASYVDSNNTMQSNARVLVIPASSFTEYTLALDSTKVIDYISFNTEKGCPIIKKIWFTNS